MAIFDISNYSDLNRYYDATMHCTTVEDAQHFCNYLATQGLIWKNGKEYDSEWSLTLARKMVKMCGEIYFFFNKGTFSVSLEKSDDIDFEFIDFKW